MVQALKTLGFSLAPPSFTYVLHHLGPTLTSTLFQVHYYDPQVALAARMASRATSSRNGTTTSNVRRNLFHHHLSRRPASASTSTSATTFEVPTDSNSDIVSRDQNGNYQVETQVIPPIGEEQQQLENEQDKEKQSTLDSLTPVFERH